MSTFNYNTLNEKTVAELREIVRSRGIVGFSKKNKELTIKAILKSFESDTKPSCCENIEKPTKSEYSEEKVTAATFTMSSILTKPSAKEGDRTTTTINVSCGANSSSFPVAGKSVGSVQEFLKEVLNISSIAQGQVNGKLVESNYILKSGDNLEFIKPAGRKG